MPVNRSPDGYRLISADSHLTEPGEIAGVSREPGQVLRGHLAEQGGRVAARLRPPGRVDRGEQVPRVGVPGPAEVQHQIAQPGERFRQRGADREAADGSHAERP